ncbi:MAG: hypothetical protein RBQ99_04585 [Trichlorobacter sp.]|nr:hypothetical protein [Trichlorobacter sp.]
MKKRVRRRATWYLEKEMMQANSLKEASIIRHRFQGEILYGVIESGGKDAKVWIDLNSKEINESRFASFPLKYQPKHERGKYKKGKEMAFIVARVNLIKHHNGSLATEIVLSRTAVDLPKKLLEQQTPETFTTLRRVPGKYTLLLAHKNPKRLDKKVIKAIKKEIGEVLIFKEADR